MFSSEVNALISLIEDPDESIYSHVRNELKNYGVEIIPQLEQVWEMHNYGPLFHHRLEELIASIQYEAVYSRLKAWRDSEDQDLLEGALILNRYQYPSFDEDELRRIVSRIRQDIWLELNDNLTAFEVVRVFNHILFTHHSFRKNSDHASEPQSNYLTDLLTMKSGNPVSLGILYTQLARSLDVPIYGVNLPGHFILCYLDHSPEDYELGLEPMEAEVLFYINPYNEGMVLHEEEISEFLRQQEIPEHEQFFRPCSNADMISRMINNLIHNYIALNKEDKVRELRALQSVLLEVES